MRKMLLAAAALAVALAASAQEPKFDFRRDSTRTSGFTLPDSLAHMSPWKPDYKTMAPVRTKPTVSMTSVVVIQKENLPSRITVIDNNTLRLGQHFNLSNGQAWNWSPFPDAFLDARTLSPCRGNALPGLPLSLKSRLPAMGSLLFRYQNLCTARTGHFPVFSHPASTNCCQVLVRTWFRSERYAYTFTSRV